MVESPRSSYVEILTPQRMALGGGDVRRSCQKSWAFWILWKRLKRLPLSFPLCRDPVQRNHLWVMREPQSDTNTPAFWPQTSPQIASELWDVDAAAWATLFCSIFVRVALTDRETIPFWMQCPALAWVMLWGFLRICQKPYPHPHRGSVQNTSKPLLPLVAHILRWAQGRVWSGDS